MSWDKIRPGALAITIVISVFWSLQILNTYSINMTKAEERSSSVGRSIERVKRDVDQLNERSKGLERSFLEVEARLHKLEQRISNIEEFLRSLNL